MTHDLLRQLRQWRDEQARIEGVEGYRVLNNSVLEALARSLPRDRDALCAVKGIKEAKYRKYGKTLLTLIAEHTGSIGEEAGGQTIFGETESKHDLDSTEPTAPLSVSQFLDSLNLELSGMAARLRGEVSSVDIRERVVYFTLKDAADESVLPCLIFRYQYEVSGVQLVVGSEVIVEGVPDVYKPSGRLSLKVGVIEYAGEGALKKAYDLLYKKLEGVGVFASERKRPIPEFVERIALITSREGAAIGDFTMNLARAGFRVDFFPTLVEGKKAVFEIVEAIHHFNRTPRRYDVLVIIRGGGSLESLQAFNTETLVNEVVRSHIPVLAGIGHERDVSLVALAADQMVSTPTAAARILSESWDEARVNLGERRTALRHLVQAFQMTVHERVRRAEAVLRDSLDGIMAQSDSARVAFREAVVLFPEYVRRIAARLQHDPAQWWMQVSSALSRLRHQLRTAEGQLHQYDPSRVLRLGYALVRKEGAIVRGARALQVGDRVDIQLGRGRVESEVRRIIEK